MLANPNPVFYVGAISVAAVVAFMLTSTERPAPVEPQRNFAETWHDTLAVARKSDRIDPAPVLPSAVVFAPAVLQGGGLDSAAPSVHREPVVRHLHRKANPDICARHGRVKVTTGKRWRCVKRAYK